MYRGYQNEFMSMRDATLQLLGEEILVLCLAILIGPALRQQSKYNKLFHRAFVPLS